MEELNIYVYKEDELPNFNWVGENPMLVGTEYEGRFYKSFDPVNHCTNDWYNTDFPYKNNLKDISFVDDVEKADFIILPYPLEELIVKEGIDGTVNYIKSLKYYEKYYQKHMFLVWQDTSNMLMIDGILFKSGVNNQVRIENKYAIAYPVKDFKNDLCYDEKKIVNDINFVGCNLTSQVRKRSIDALMNCNNLKKVVCCLDDFFGRLKFNPIREGQKALFMESILNSKLSYCPRGKNEGSIRFFETMSLGRCIVLVGDTYTYPLENKIDWSEFCFRISESDLPVLEEKIQEILKLGTVELLRRGKKAREVWEKYFSLDTMLITWWNMLRKIKYKDNL